MAVARYLVVACLSCIASASVIAAGGYPTKPIELVVPWPPGGGSDSVGRAIGEATRSSFSQPTVIVNKPGASGTIGYSYVATSPPDGYRVLLITPELLLAPLMGIGKTTIDEFQPLARFTDDPLAITVRSDAPWKSIEEFLAYSKANPGKATISIAGNGTVHHIGAAALSQATGIPFSTVPYQGSAPAIMGLLSGDVQATTAAYAELSQHVVAGKLRTLAVMADKRIDSLPTVPTFKERGYDLRYSTWRGLAVHKSTPAQIVEQWRNVAGEAARSQGFKSKMASLNLTPAYADMPDFGNSVQQQAKDYKGLLTTLKVKE